MPPSGMSMMGRLFDMTADQAIVAAYKHAKDDRRTLKQAKEFLGELLADGPVAATEAKKLPRKKASVKSHLNERGSRWE